METRPKVLVVNDDQEQRRKIQKAIAQFCEVEAPETHQALVDALKPENGPYRLVLLDWEFSFWNPEGRPRNGAEVVEALQKERKRSPYIILYTNHSYRKDVRQTARAYGLPIAVPTDPKDQGLVVEAVHALVC